MSGIDRIIGLRGGGKNAIDGSSDKVDIQQHEYDIEQWLLWKYVQHCLLLAVE